MISKQKVNKYLQNFIERMEAAGLLSEVEFIFTYGSTTREVEYVPNINVGIIVRELNADKLSSWRKTIRYMLKKGKSMPLLMTKDEFVNSSDVFPLEYLDMKIRHFKLYGKDVFDELELGLENMRLQIEEELRAKYVRMREIYLSPHSKYLLKKVLYKSLSSLYLLLRSLIYFQIQRAPNAYEGLLDGRTPDEIIKDMTATQIFEFLKMKNGLDLKTLSAYQVRKYSNKKIEINDASFLQIIDEWKRIVEFIDKEKI